MKIEQHNNTPTFGNFAIIREDEPAKYIKQMEVKNQQELETLIREVAQYNNALSESDGDKHYKLINI
jgi:hypothetical protein